MVSELQKKQLVIFSLGWFAYATTYFLRKPLGVIKTDLETEFHFTKTQLGWLDTALLLPYALMQMLLGSLGDYLGARKTMGYGMLLSALSMITFGHWSNYYIFFTLFFICGTAQSVCWPNCGKTLGSWYPDSVRNTIFGVFGTCAFAGGIIGSALAVVLQKYGWRNVFLIPSLLVGLFGILVLLFFRSPKEAGVEIPGKERETLLNKKEPTKLSCWDYLKIPMLPEVAMAVFCLKIVRYCMYMWLPLYLLNHLNYEKAEAGYFSTTFEIGGVVGSFLIGYIIDKCFSGRNLVATTIFALLSTISLVMFHLTSESGRIFNTIFLVLAGAFNCGPDSILGGAVPAQLGEMDGRDSAASVTGLINGFGSFGTVAEGPVIGLISQHYSWNSVFYLMISLSLLGTLCVFRAAIIFRKIQRHRSLLDIS